MDATIHIVQAIKREFEMDIVMVKTSSKTNLTFAPQLVWGFYKNNKDVGKISLLLRRWAQ